MNLTELTLKNKVVVYFMLLLVLLGGITSYFSMGKLEDSVFTVKTALVITRYPGASPHEVEQEVSEVIERAAQEMDGIDEIYSSSYAGLSIVQVDVDESLRADVMPQTWDILRKKIRDARSKLPQQAELPVIVDDFGDVYGMFYAVTGDGFSYEELNDYAQYLKRELLVADQVGKITLFGARTECIDVIINDNKITELGVNPGVIISNIQTQSNIASAGRIEMNNQYIRVKGNMSYKNLDEIKNTLIQIGNEQIYLKDIATVKKSYIEPAQNLMKFNTNEAIGLAVSTTSGGNVLLLEENINKKLSKIRANLPVGIEITEIYNEAKEVAEANNMFITNLLESVGIVVVILLLFMGLRSGILIGSGLIFSILGTLIVMNTFNISLHRTSLAAIIIAMGMLVDNAIVVTDGALVSLQRGFNKKKAIINISKTTALPLLGATAIAIFAFMPVYLAPNSAGEITRDLFLVLAISLSLSWVFAMTQTALINERFLKSTKKIEDPYGSRVYIIFKSFLEAVLKRKWISLITLVMMLFVAIVAFTKTRKAFFMPLDKTYLLIDYWLPEGSTINKVSVDLEKAEKYLFDNYKNIENITTSLSRTPPRYLLTAHTENYNSSFGQLMIETTEAEHANNMKPDLRDYFASEFPQARVRVKGYISGPPIKYKVEARFIGSDPAVLRAIADSVKLIMHNEPACGDISDNWRNKVMTWSPEYSSIKAKKAGISRKDLGETIQRLTSTGLGIGVYRENEENKPIFLKVESNSQNSTERILNTGVWSRYSNNSVPLKEVIDSVAVSWENSVIQHYNRQRAITVQCDPKDQTMTGSTLLGKIKDDIEAIPLPDGYSMMWDGEYKPSLESNEATGAYMPLAMLLIVIIIVMLFNSVRRSVIVLAIIPLSIIGVAIGLFVTGSAFGFMAIVGFLGLIGMVLKNAIVLMDQISINLSKEGLPPYQAVVSASISRSRPVFLAALTTMLGMLPIVTDSMYGSMAITIIFGLLVATVLTLVVVPLLYVIFYRVKV